MNHELVIELMEILIEGELLALILIACLIYKMGRLSILHHPRLRNGGYASALIAFISFLHYELVSYGVSDAGMLLSFVIRALLAAGMACGGVWILLTILGFLWGSIHSLIQALHQQLRQYRLTIAERRREREHRIERERHSAKEESERLRREQQWLAESPERKQTEQQQLLEQREREEIILECHLLYDQHAHTLKDLYTAEKFQDYLHQYMSGSTPLELLKRRAEQLQNLLQSILKRAGGSLHPFGSLEEITQFYQEQKEVVASLDCDEATQQSFLAQINRQEDQSIEEFLLP